jgi:xylulokinase
MKPCLLVHDLGTSGDKASIYDADGILQGAVTIPYGTTSPASSWCEQNPEEWWAAVAASTRAVLARAGIAPRAIAALTFSGQMMGCVPVDTDGNALRQAIIWADTRAQEQAKHISDSIGAETAYRICGHRPSASYSAAKIAWIRDNEPDVYVRAAAFLQAKDYIIGRVTGRFVTDPSDASGTNLFDLEKGIWSPELVEAAGLDFGRLPEVVPSTSVVSGLNAKGATGLGLLEGTPVVAGGADGSCAAVGAGAVDVDDAYVCLGSSAWVGVCTDDPLFDPEMRTFTWAHLISDRYLPTGTMQTAGLSYEWLSGILQCGQGDDSTGLDSLAAEAPPGCNGLLFLPYLLGERSPHWNPHARGAFVGLTMAHQRPHLVRAVLEGTALNLRTILECFRRLGVSSSELWAVGGGARSPLYLDILANVFGVPVSEPSDVHSATGLGAAVAAGVGVGLFDSWKIAKEIRSSVATHKPSPDLAALYESLHSIFTSAYCSLEATNEELFAFATEAGGCQK